MISEEFQQLTKQDEVTHSTTHIKERDLRGKLFDENKSIIEIKEELVGKSKELSHFKSDNAAMLRTQEKNKMFNENREEKELLEAERRNNDMIQHCLKKVIEAGVELENRKRQYDDMSMIKELDSENMELIVFWQFLHDAIENGRLHEPRNRRRPRKDLRARKPP